MTATLTRPAPPAVPQASCRPALDVVLPVYDEQRDLEPCVRQLHAYLTGTFPCPFRITIAGNVSSAQKEMLQAALPEVRVAHLAEMGPRQALRIAWLQSDALVLAYMDVDLSTDLAERAGLRIAEVPVDWADAPGSRAGTAATALADLRRAARLGRAPLMSPPLASRPLASHPLASRSAS